MQRNFHCDKDEKRGIYVVRDGKPVLIEQKCGTRLGEALYGIQFKKDITRLFPPEDFDKKWFCVSCRNKIF